MVETGRDAGCRFVPITASRNSVLSSQPRLSLPLVAEMRPCRRWSPASLRSGRQGAGRRHRRELPRDLPGVLNAASPYAHPITANMMGQGDAARGVRAGAASTSDPMLDAGMR